MTAEQIRDTLYEEQATPFEKEKVTLQYRPHPRGNTWSWYWVLLPADKSRALIHGTAVSRAQASLDGRKAARKLKVVIGTVEIVQPHDEEGFKSDPRPSWCVEP